MPLRAMQLIVAGADADDPALVAACTENGHRLCEQLLLQYAAPKPSSPPPEPPATPEAPENISMPPISGSGGTPPSSAPHVDLADLDLHAAAASAQAAAASVEAAARETGLDPSI